MKLTPYNQMFLNVYSGQRLCENALKAIMAPLFEGAINESINPFGSIKSWMGATHIQMRTLKKVGTEMSLDVLAYNMKRADSILGVPTLMAAIRS